MPRDSEIRHTAPQPQNQKCVSGILLKTHAIIMRRASERGELGTRFANHVRFAREDGFVERASSAKWGNFEYIKYYIIVRGATGEMVHIGKRGVYEGGSFVTPVFRPFRMPIPYLFPSQQSTPMAMPETKKQLQNGG